MLKCPKILHLALLLLSVFCLEALVPPHPNYKALPNAWQASRAEYESFWEPNPGAVASFPLSGQKTELPNNILVLMVDFPDQRFKTAADFPDYLDHDAAYFERWMLHLGDFFLDASHGQYELSYTVYPQVLTVDKSIAYYGRDGLERVDVNLPFILQDLMPLCDDAIDFSQYGGLIIFHAGPGQETDIEKKRLDEIWSTSLTRKRLQAAYDPDNDDYPGFTTNDGAVFTNIIIVPEDEWQDYFPTAADIYPHYVFSFYGVLAHQYGHVLGLPSLFDGSGNSQGIGNWGLMGTGIWNAGGYVPAQLSAWCRYYLGWEAAQEIVDDAYNLPLDHFLNYDPDARRLYKLVISEHEYFLIENRQQNPDGSRDPYNNLPSYTFKLLPEGEQEYYEDYPLLPYFDIMKNRYSGSEWDFFLPGFGTTDPPLDGSGILIWHIDEKVIAEKFTANFDLNRVNSNPRHKGVDLEEADGYQHLDTSVANEYKYGSPNDSYRQGNNDYFGNSLHEGRIWLPSSESYYGGVPLEVYDISESGNTMYFSVRFSWKLSAGYEGENPYPAAVIDFDGDGEEEIFYPMPDGKLALFKADAMAPGFPKQISPLAGLYTWDGDALYLPAQFENLARLYRLNANEGRYIYTGQGLYWKSHPVDAGDKLYLPLASESGQSSILIYDKVSETLDTEGISLSKTIASNLVNSEDKLWVLARAAADPFYSIIEYDKGSGGINSQETHIPADSLAFGLYGVEFSEDGGQSLIVQCPSSLWVYELVAGELSIRKGFPVARADSSHAAISVADILRLGSLQIIWSGANGIRIIDYSGTDNSPYTLFLDGEDDGISASALVQDLDGDGLPDLAGSFSLNRLGYWGANLKRKSGFPVSFKNRSRNMPFVAQGQDGKYYLWQAADNGYIYRAPLPDYKARQQEGRWSAEYQSLGRGAYQSYYRQQENPYSGNKILIPQECFIYPNPLKRYHDGGLHLNIMPRIDTMVICSIYDSSGKLVYKESGFAYKYLPNRELFQIPASKLSSGIYIAVIQAGSESLNIKFGIEK